MSDAAKIAIAVILAWVAVIAACAAADISKNDAEARKVEALAKACSCPDGGAR